MTKSLGDQITTNSLVDDKGYNLSLGVKTYDPDHPTLGDVIHGRVNAIDYIVLTAKNIFSPD